MSTLKKRMYSFFLLSQIRCLGDRTVAENTEMDRLGELTTLARVLKHVTLIYLSPNSSFYSSI